MASCTALCTNFKNSSTDLSNFASTSPMRNCSNFSTITCSFLNKKSTRRKVSIGSSWISVWISKLASSWWKRYSTSSQQNDFFFYRFEQTNGLLKKPAGLGWSGAERGKNDRSHWARKGDQCTSKTLTLWEWIPTALTDSNPDLYSLPNTAEKRLLWFFEWLALI